MFKPIGITPGDNFDSVDEALVVREAMLKQATEEKVGELLENNQLKSWEGISFEIEVNTVTGGRHGKKIMKVGENDKWFGLDDCKVVKSGAGHEKYKFEGENVEVLAKTLVVREAMLKAAAEDKVRELQENNQFNGWGRLNFEVEVKTVTGERREEDVGKVEVLAKKNRFVGEPGKKDALGSSGMEILFACLLTMYAFLMLPEETTKIAMFC